MSSETETLQARVHGTADAGPTLIYLPGLHGDWSLVGSFRVAVTGRVRFVEFTYPRDLTWSARDYAVAIQDTLRNQTVERGWLLAESFGSLIAWAMMEKSVEPSAVAFQPLGLILAGGFVRHPFPWGAGWLRRIGQATPMNVYRALLAGYAWFAKCRHRHAPETLASIDEFVARRTELDRRAMRARLKLIECDDPRDIARRTTLPVYYLAGLVDPLVPWPYVRWWLRRHCPGYRTGRTFWLADHNALATAPEAAARQVLRWMAEAHPSQ